MFFNRAGEVSYTFALLDPQATFQVQVLENLTQFRHHAPGQVGIQAHREINVNPQIVPRAEFGKHLGAQAVPYLKVSSARRNPTSPSRTPKSPCSAWRAVALNASGQCSSHGSGNRSPSSIGLHVASGRLAHHRCNVLGCPYWIDFSRAACFDTTAIGKSTSARRLHSLGIMGVVPFPPLASLQPVCPHLDTVAGRPG